MEGGASDGVEGGLRENRFQSGRALRWAAAIESGLDGVVNGIEIMEGIQTIFRVEDVVAMGPLVPCDIPKLLDELGDPTETGA